MDIVKARTLKPWEGRKLKSMKHQLTNAVNRLHARIILLSRGGGTNAQIAKQNDPGAAMDDPKAYAANRKRRAKQKQ